MDLCDVVAIVVVEMRQVVVVGGRHNLVSGLVGKEYNSALATAHCLGFTRIRFLAGASCVKDERVLQNVNDCWFAARSAQSKEIPSV